MQSQRYGVRTELTQSDDFKTRIQDSVDVLKTHLEEGHIIYGMDPTMRIA